MKKRLITSGIAAAALLLAGCQGASPDESPTEAEEALERDSEGGGADLAAIDEFLAPYVERPSQITVTEPITDPIPEDGEIYFIECGVPACVTLGDALEEATDLLGWKLKRVQAGLSPETIKDGWSQAANATPAPMGVIGSGFDEVIIAEEVAALKEKGVPSVSISTNDPTPIEGNLAAALGTGEDRNVLVGALQAATILKDSGGEANTVYVYSPSLASQGPLVRGFEEKYKELCPDCGLDLLEVSPESIGSSLPQEIAAYLQAHPDVNYGATGFGDMGVGLPSALKTAGLEDQIRMVTDTPGVTVSSYMESGDLFFAATAFPGEEFVWMAVDIILRHQLDLDPSVTVDAEIPQWVVYADEIPSTTEDFPVVEDYQEQFAELWGISK